MKFDILNGDKSFSSNALLGGDREATKRQTVEEHNALLDPYTTDTGMAIFAAPPAVRPLILQKAIEEAEEREAESPHYWEDEEPRRPITQSSSWVGNTEYNPTTSITTIALGKNGKTIARYTSAEQMDSMVNAPSIGRFVLSNFLK